MNNKNIIKEVKKEDGEYIKNYIKTLDSNTSNIEQ